MRKNTSELFDDSQFSDLREAVLTSLFVLNKTDVITSVYHYEEDGMWTFFGDSEVAESDYRLVAIEEIVDLDPSILLLPDMKPGFYARRKGVNDTFVIASI
ncbi:hypothetical protein [Sphingobacterium bambusae]|uniref:DUF2185 domain-containing protein n=1 Tax=Sphingobacterium bambusae TaxID=662858 RepID=A0ABW6BGU3_9SPHI|nr:hypothetical protein [Sphingobacterium bambusae]WPL49591.1 hypothetical protein SCB77_03885 [Sphingobacterium bambusae]